MLILIKGAPGTGTSALADRLATALDLPPVRWQVEPELMETAQRLMGGWIDLAAYFASCRHLDMERVTTLLHIGHWDELPPPPQWREGADRGEMLVWRSRVLAQLEAGRLLPELFELTCRLVDAAEHAVVEGRILGTTLADSQLTRMLRGRYQEVPILRILLLRQPAAGAGGDPSIALVNGTVCSHDQVLQAVRRESDGRIAVAADPGWTWSGGGSAPALRAGEAPPELLHQVRAT